MKAGTLKWCIRRYDGLNEICRHEIPYRHLSERQLVEVLKRLASRHLTEREVIASSLNGHAKSETRLLCVRRDGNSESFTCGSDPYYTATVSKCRTDLN